MTSTPVWLQRFAKLTFVATFLLVIAGGLVTSTGSGLAVPDWPLSFGQFFPPLKGGVLFEHGHRMVAGVVGILMTAQAIAIWIFEPRRWARWLALVAWVAVVAQAILGGITVLHKLPTSVSVGHAGLAAIFFALTAILALVTGKSSTGPYSDRREYVSRSIVHLCIATTAVIYIQIILGAVMRHMGAGLAIPDFPLAYGELIPPLHARTVAVHFSHRVGALIVGIFIMILVWKVERLTPPARSVRRWARILALLYALQFLLGAFTIWSMKSVHITTTHVATGSLMFALSVVLTVKAAGMRLARAPAVPVTAHPRAREVTT